MSERVGSVRQHVPITLGIRAQLLLLLLLSSGLTPSPLRQAVLRNATTRDQQQLQAGPQATKEFGHCKLFNPVN